MFKTSFAAAVGTALGAMALCASSVPAAAHATFDRAEASQNSTWRGALRLPHGCNGQPTNVVRITIPEGVINVKPMPKAGWQLQTVSGPYARSYTLSGKPITEGVREVVWSGGNLHYKGQEHRSIPLEQLQVLLTQDAEFHCLQKEILGSDRAALFGLPIQTWAPDLHDFAETAALISHMDLVISVDTAVAHLTGAMGRQVWVLLPFDPDMRWMLHREDTPWYPHVMRLFRQPSLGDWAPPLARVREEMRHLIC